MPHLACGTEAKLGDRVKDRETGQLGKIAYLVDDLCYASVEMDNEDILISRTDRFELVA